MATKKQHVARKKAIEKASQKAASKLIQNATEDISQIHSQSVDHGWVYDSEYKKSKIPIRNGMPGEEWLDVGRMAFRLMVNTNSGFVQAIETFKCSILNAAEEDANGNRSQAARSLLIARQSMYNIIHRHSLGVGRIRGRRSRIRNREPRIDD